MSVQVRLARSAEKELLALPLSVQRRFRAAIDDLAAHWPVLTRDALRLKGRGNGWRLRAGAIAPCSRPPTGRWCSPRS